MKIIVGAISSHHPFSAGERCNWSQWVGGLQRLGHEVYFVEQTSKDACFDSKGNRCNFQQSVHKHLFLDTMRRFGLAQKACLIYENGYDSAGLTIRSMESVARTADLLINFSGCVSADMIMENVRRRAFIDLDPVYTQIWDATGNPDINMRRHNIHFTVGLNIGTEYCRMPDCGLEWFGLGRPMVLDMWPKNCNSACRNFTTIANWSVFGDIFFQDEWYRSKAHEFLKFAEIAKHSDQAFEVVLGSVWDDSSQGAEVLTKNKWLVVGSEKIATLDRYRSYINASRAEIGIAKNAYVKSRSGWFSDRAAHYLACGKPVLVQSTGFERVFPTGLGVLSFSQIDEALIGVEEINSDYQKHCKAASDFAEEYLDYRKVIPKMIEQCMTVQSGNAV